MKAFFKTILYVPAYNLLIFLAYIFSGSVGWAVVAITVIIRVILLPSSIKAARASVKLQAIQPRMSQIKEKHKGDQKKQSEEMMKMYKEEGTSPFGTCLPLLIQLPILFVLYRVFLIGFDTSRYDLLYSFTSRPETLHTVFMGINIARPDPWVLPIIAGVLQLLLSFMTLPKVDPKAKKDPTQAITRQMVLIFPVVTVIISKSLPAALPLYWIITTIFSVGQQYYVNKTIKNNPKLKKQDPKLSNTPSNPPDDSSDKSSNRKGGSKKTTKDYMTKIIRKRLDKQDRKRGVEITIREK